MVRKSYLSLLIVFSFLFIPPVFANNLTISSVGLTSQDIDDQIYDIQFSIAWENSWFDAGAPSPAANWDAAWVFAKFSKWDSGAKAWGNWTHCTLSSTDGDHTPAVGSQIRTGLTPVAAGTGKGLFIYRDATGTGAVNFLDVKMRWLYGVDGVGNTDKVRVRVFGVEMVYIPQASFYLGDVNAPTDPGDINSFFKYGCTLLPCTYPVTSEGAIQLGTASGNLYYRNDNANDGDRLTAAIPAAFPKGYGAFYVMKYELSQGRYRDFLNTLTRAQQDNRTAVRTEDLYAMSADANIRYRNGIRNPGAIPAGALNFLCDLDGAAADNTAPADNLPNQADDGEGVAMNYLSWADLAAYADWAALRPLTEFEFEKAARGPQLAMNDEYAWGDTTAGAVPGGISNSGQLSEVPDQGKMNYDGGISGPLRNGSFSTALSTTRTLSGASYYGVMDLSGNVWERAVTPTRTSALVFDGIPGDGALDAAGDADTANWPSTSGDGAGLRGGSWSTTASVARVADRDSGALTDAGRANNYGGRCGRIAP